jgi:Ser/Thr protein kinase RdoA (MazF antagonist)
MLLLERVHALAALDGADCPERWADERIEIALRAIGRIHGEWLERGTALSAIFDAAIGTELDVATAARPLWEALAAHAQPWLQRWLGDAGVCVHAQLVRSLPEWLTAMQRHPRTLIHNDFNPRNFVLRAAAGGPQLCAFDWELADYGLPQRDLVELLCFVLPPAAMPSRIEHLVDYHRTIVERTARQPISAVAWREGIQLALADFGVRRLPMYFLAQRFRPQSFLERVTRTWWRLTQLYGEAA